MREIEIKARVGDEKILRDVLLARGVKLSAPIKQHDEVFAVLGAAPGTHCIWLRIRTENDKNCIFTLKRSVTSKHDSIEHETEISNPEELKQIIEILGYVPFSDITKTRQKAKIGDIEICLDNVDGLGVFIEAERLCEHDADATTVLAELWLLLKSLAIPKTDEVLEGYDVMINNVKKNN